ncbi:MAG: NADH-quinone oxidoreductase subunit J [Rhodospirillaceae bacterium]|jgi:NADH-quinone oxidoreductase subunit J|nr:NADH-quinone oxidoreductase subunit J [Alphaproteobacteria bacterium]CAI8346460.1 MAG: NADH-quinone oxidoreductase subunit J [Rhodospirillaceae bacterium]
MLSSVFFYLFAGICCLAGLMVVSSRNPVHSVLFLILAFFNAAGLFILLNAEFLAMLLVVVYVGAVAVLFLFVVMMLDINYSELREGFQKYRSLGLLIGAVLLVELFATFFEYSGNVKSLPSPGAVHNTKALGQVIYTDYIYLFQLAGLILLVAMIGAIALTLRKRSGVRKQVIADQNSRTRAETVKLAKVETGAGVKEAS